MFFELLSNLKECAKNKNSENDSSNKLAADKRLITDRIRAMVTKV
jgi:hypothetical protein